MRKINAYTNKCLTITKNPRKIMQEIPAYTLAVFSKGVYCGYSIQQECHFLRCTHSLKYD